VKDQPAGRARARGPKAAPAPSGAAGTVVPVHRSERVAERIEAAPPRRHAVSARAAERELRRCAFALLSHYLTVHGVIAEQLRLQPVELLILIATTTGNVQRALRPEALPDAIRGSSSMPMAMVVPMSRRAIARATGIPTETVRRHVRSMVERGILEALPRGVHVPNRLAERWVAPALVRLVESHVACTERLIALGAITPLPARPEASGTG
jgi:hypothetical protein